MVCTTGLHFLITHAQCTHAGVIQSLITLIAGLEQDMREASFTVHLVLQHT